MTKYLYEYYRQTKQRLSIFEREKENDEIGEIVEDWKEFIAAIEENHPDIVAQYEREKAIQDSFTPEQINFICWQIGDWYIAWEKKMWVDGKPNQHWLGLAKEQLKTMICGD